MSTSVITRSGCSAWTMVSASRPLTASSSRWPACRSNVTRSLRLAERSSTTRMVAMGSLLVWIHMCEESEGGHGGFVNLLEIPPARIVGRGFGDQDLGKAADDGQLIFEVVTALVVVGHRRRAHQS